MCVPYTGSQAWTSSLGYKTLDEWRPWTSNDQVAGYLQGYDHNLTFLTIKVIISINIFLLKNWYYFVQIDHSFDFEFIY